MDSRSSPPLDMHRVFSDNSSSSSSSSPPPTTIPLKTESNISVRIDPAHPDAIILQSKTRYSTSEISQLLAVLGNESNKKINQLQQRVDEQQTEINILRSDVGALMNKFNMLLEVQPNQSLHYSTQQVPDYFAELNNDQHSTQPEHGSSAYPTSTQAGLLSSLPASGYSFHGSKRYRLPDQTSQTNSHGNYQPHQ